MVCNKKVVESLIKAGAFDSLGHPRKGLLLVHADAIDAVMSTKKAASIGPVRPVRRRWTAPAPSELDAVFDVKVPGRRVGHQAPARRGAGDARALRVRAPAARGGAGAARPSPTPRSPTILEGTVPDGHQVTVGGILAGVNRRVNKNGEPWASAQLEDLAGGIEVLFFPRCYQVVGVDVAEDAIVLVKARVNRRDDRVSLIVNDLAVPDLSAGGPGAPGAPLRVRVPFHRSTHDDRENEARRSVQRPCCDEQLVLHHEAHRNRREARIGIEQGDDRGHVGPANRQHQQHAEQQ